MDKKEIRTIIAKRVAAALSDKSVVNLGIGLPTLVGNYIPETRSILLQSENGFVGLGEAAARGEEDKDLINAGAQYVTTIPGAAFFDSASSFAMIRGGHVDATVLGAFQVDEKGNIANWLIPGGNVSGVGGAMDLITGSKKVIVAMEHTSKGKKKILENCTLPLTATGQVNCIITEMAYFDVTDKGLLLKELGPGATLELVRENTQAGFEVAPDLGHFG